MTMRRTPPGPPPPHDPDVLALVDAGLDQREPDAAALARYSAPDAVATRAAREAERRAQDWPDLARYRAANAEVRAPDMVMIGDSLTEIWGRAMPEMFGERIVNRGISGQTSAQILLRFMADVVDLAPARVHILCGTNDIAGNTGPTTPEDYRRNIRAMAALARAHGIAVLLASIPPAGAIPWQPAAEPRLWVPELNAWLRGFAADGAHAYIDYAAILDDGRGALQDRYSADGVHLTRAAYHAMAAMLPTG